MAKVQPTITNIVKSNIRKSTTFSKSHGLIARLKQADAWLLQKIKAVLLTILVMISMFLSDVINNAATAIIMAPIGASIATTLGYPIEAFLMAVCIGASCTFLSPIGHQSNLLVMSPGGYRFSDYARMGWLLDILVVLVSVPVIIPFWF